MCACHTIHGYVSGQWIFAGIYVQNLLKLQSFILTFFFTVMVDIGKLRIKFSGGLA